MILTQVPFFVSFVHLHVSGESFGRVLSVSFLSLVEHLIFGILRTVVRNDVANNKGGNAIF